MATYRVDRTYEENYRLGPASDGPLPDRGKTRSATAAQSATELFGRAVRSRIGIAAGLLLNSKWIEFYAHFGYGILTYKTVRGSHRPCYPPPNWVRVRCEGGELPADPELPLVTIEPTATAEPDATWAVCFGMPSMAPAVWRPDVEAAKRSLGPDQLLNVSVVGTPAAGGDFDDLVDDFARCAAWAKESGADLIEANLSCPNVCSAEGQIYQSPESSRRVASRIRAVIGSTPLLIKTGNFVDLGKLAEFLRSVSGVADAIVLVNAVQRRVHTPAGTPAFGDYERVGIIGRAIHRTSVQIVADACRIVERERLGLSILGVGGVFTAPDAKDFFDAGAPAVFLGGAPMIDPDLAARLEWME